MVGFLSRFLVLDFSSKSSFDACISGSTSALMCRYSFPSTETAIYLWACILFLNNYTAVSKHKHASLCAQKRHLLLQTCWFYFLLSTGHITLWTTWLVIYLYLNHFFIGGTASYFPVYKYWTQRAGFVLHKLVEFSGWKKFPQRRSIWISFLFFFILMIACVPNLIDFSANHKSEKQEWDDIFCI